MDHVCAGIARRGIENASQTNEFPGRWQSGQSQQAVNLPPSGYGGSNPPLPTTLRLGASCGGQAKANVRVERNAWGAKAGVTQW